MTTWFLTPYAYEKNKRRGLNETLSWDSFFYSPMMFWWSIFSWPVRMILNFWRDH